MKPLRIESIDDPRIASFRDVRDRDLLRERGEFIVEGRANLRRLVHDSPLGPRSVFLSEPASAALRETVASLPDDVSIYVATRAVLSGIAGFDIHRGCLALCDRPVAPPLSSLWPRGPARRSSSCSSI